MRKESVAKKSEKIEGNRGMKGWKRNGRMKFRCRKKNKSSSKNEYD